MIFKFEIPYMDLNEIEQQTDVCFLIADVIVMSCSYMQTLSLRIKKIY